MTQNWLRHCFRSSEAHVIFRSEILLSRSMQVTRRDYKVGIRVPTQTGKPGKWEGIFQSGNF